VGSVTATGTHLSARPALLPAPARNDLSQNPDHPFIFCRKKIEPPAD
jgi:hypothetical protein